VGESDLLVEADVVGDLLFPVDIHPSDFAACGSVTIINNSKFFH
jgi:hypothetical protein